MIDFLKRILQFTRFFPSSTYTCFNIKGTKYLTRLRLGLSQYCDKKFQYGFTDSRNPITIL